jgi:hypothetical protein
MRGTSGRIVKEKKKKSFLKAGAVYFPRIENIIGSAQ